MHCCDTPKSKRRPSGRLRAGGSKSIGRKPSMGAFGNEHHIVPESSMKDQLGPEKISGLQKNARVGLVYTFVTSNDGSPFTSAP